MVYPDTLLDNYLDMLFGVTFKATALKGSCDYAESNAPSSQLNDIKINMPGCILKKK